MDNKNWFKHLPDNINKYIPLPNEYGFKKILGEVSKHDKSYLHNFKITYKTTKISCIKKENVVSLTNTRAHKYFIKFSLEQKQKLKQLFYQSELLYNFCVDIWKNYKTLQTNEHVFQFFRSLVLKHFYDEKKLRYYQIVGEVVHQLKRQSLLNKNCSLKVKKAVKKELLCYYKKKFNKVFETETNDLDKILDELAEALKIHLKKKKLTLESILKKQTKQMLEHHKKRLYEQFGEKKAPVKNRIIPRELIESEIFEFLTNLKVARINYFNKKTQNESNNIQTKPFVMKYKNVLNTQTITCGYRALSKKGIYFSYVGQLNCKNYEYIKNNYIVGKRESKLMYDLKTKNYYLFILKDIEIIEKQRRHQVVALDPGVTKFQTQYSTKEHGYYHHKKIDKLVNKLYNGPKNKKRKTTLKRYSSRIKGLVKQLHVKTAKYLCENYKTILLPSFKIKSMVKNKTPELQKIPGQKELSKYHKYKMYRLEHYNFKLLLKSFAQKTNTQLFDDVDESYTTQTCTNCGKQSKEYKDRQKICECNYTCDRDLTGSRNILLKFAIKQSMK